MVESCRKAIGSVLQVHACGCFHAPTSDGQQLQKPPSGTYAMPKFHCNHARLEEGAP